MRDITNRSRNVFWRMLGMPLLLLVATSPAMGSGIGPQQVITRAAEGAYSVYATDLDGDGDADVLSVSWEDDKIAWYENLSNGSFDAQQVITTAADGTHSVYATDLDRDGDADVLSASWDDDKAAWYENLSNGNFGTQQTVIFARLRLGTGMCRLCLGTNARFFLVTPLQRCHASGDAPASRVRCFSLGVERLKIGNTAGAVLPVNYGASPCINID